MSNIYRMIRGTWFTYWHGYKETEAKDDISRWASGNLPIDVWALDSE